MGLLQAIVAMFFLLAEPFLSYPDPQILAYQL